MPNIEDAKSQDYEEILRVISRERKRLMRDGWLLPLTIEASGADESRLFGVEFDGLRYMTADDGEKRLPALKFPVTISITDRSGQVLLLKLSEPFR